MLKMLYRLKKTKAFTLVELIIAMAVMVILVGAAMALFTPVKSIADSLTDDSQVTANSDVILNYISQRLEKATTCNINLYYEDSTKHGIYTMDMSDMTGAAYKGKVVYDNISDKSVEKLYLMLIIRQNDMNYLLDLGLMGDSTSFKYNQKIWSMVNIPEYPTTEAKNQYLIDKYSVFRDEFYEDVRYKYSFDISGTVDTGKWIKVGITPCEKTEFNEAGTTNEAKNNMSILTETRNKMFRMINMELTGVAPESDVTLKDKNYLEYENGNPVIIGIYYTIKDYAA